MTKQRLQEIRKKYSEMRKKNDPVIAEYIKKINELRKEEEDLVREIKSLLFELGICSCCDQTLDECGGEC